MPSIKVYFSDGSIEIFHEDQSLQTVVKRPDNEHPLRESVSQSEVFTLWSHHHDGLIPSFLEVLANSMYFFDIEKPEVYFNPAAIVKIKSL